MKPSKSFHSINPENGLVFDMLSSHICDSTWGTVTHFASITFPPCLECGRTSVQRQTQQREAASLGNWVAVHQWAREQSHCGNWPSSVTLALKSIIMFLNYTYSVLKSYKNSERHNERKKPTLVPLLTHNSIHVICQNENHGNPFGWLLFASNKIHCEYFPISRYWR